MRECVYVHHELFSAWIFNCVELVRFLQINEKLELVCLKNYLKIRNNLRTTGALLDRQGSVPFAKLVRVKWKAFAHFSDLIRL